MTDQSVPPFPPVCTDPNCMYDGEHGPHGTKLEGYYPGSSRKVKDYSDPSQSKAVLPAKDEDLDFGTPVILSLNGRPTEFYTIGALAAALDRKPVTIRKLEGEKVLPHPTWRKPVNGKAKGPRLYTRHQMVGIVRAAQEAGILADKSKAISKTNFAARVREVFAEEKEA